MHACVHVRRLSRAHRTSTRIVSSRAVPRTGITCRDVRLVVRTFFVAPSISTRSRTHRIEPATATACGTRAMPPRRRALGLRGQLQAHLTQVDGAAADARDDDGCLSSPTREATSATNRMAAHETDVEAFWKEPEASKDGSKRKGRVLSLEQLLQGKKRRETREARAKEEMEKLEMELCSQSSLDASEHIVDSQLQNHVREIEEQADKLLEGLEQDDRTPPIHHVVIQEPPQLAKKQKQLHRRQVELEKLLFPKCHEECQPSTSPMETLLRSGWASNIPFARKACSKKYMDWLFQSMAFQSDIELAEAAFVAICNLLGAAEVGRQLHPRRRDEASFFASDVDNEFLENASSWSPSLEEVRQALEDLGYCGAYRMEPTRRMHTKHRLNVDALACAKEEEKMYEHHRSKVSSVMEAKPPLYNLTFLILIVPAIIEQNKSWMATHALSMICTELMLDYRCPSLLPHLTIALEALLESFPEDVWLTYRYQMVIEIVKIGPSYEGSLQAIKFLPVANPRTAQLKSLAAAGLVGYILDKDVEMLLGSSGENLTKAVLGMLGSPRELVENARQDNFPTFAALCTIIDCTDLILQREISCLGESTPAVLVSWIEFLKAIGKHVKRGSLLSSNRLKLMATELVTAYEYLKNKV
mmetsp:Transcript_10441/g.63844  ORF Transcript_10441/g.63844 Transcript_10441/m.63844 type:complete len:644 (+) Transcript_10441:1160-3091(+)